MKLAPLRSSGIFIFVFSLSAISGCKECSRMEAPLTVKTVELNTTKEPTLVGLWQSTDDQNYTREFTAQGKVIDRYAGENALDDVGTYETVDTFKENVEDMPAELLDGVEVIKIMYPESVLYFSVVTLTKESLELGFLGRGNTLSYTRLK